MSSYSVRYHCVLSEMGRKEMELMGIKEFTQGASDIVFVRGKNLHKDTEVEKALIVARAGISIANIPGWKLEGLHIPVLNSPAGHINSVVETTVGKILCSAKNFVQANNYVKSCDTPQTQLEIVKKNFKGLELRGKSVLVIGLGLIGCRVAEQLMGFGMRVYGKELKSTMDFLTRRLNQHPPGKRFLKSIHQYDGVVTVNEKFSEVDPGKMLITSDFHTALAHIDFVTIHFGFWGKPVFDKEFFCKVKKGVNIVNCDRAELAEEASVLEALKNGVCRTYNTDFAPGNLELRKHKNCIVSPHIASLTETAQKNIEKNLVHSVLSYVFNGNVINARNYPLLYLKRVGKFRVTLGNSKMINLVKVEETLKSAGYTVAQKDMKTNKSIFYAIFDLNEEVTNVEKLKLLLSQSSERVRILDRNAKFEEIHKEKGEGKYVNFIYTGQPGERSWIDERKEFVMELKRCREELKNANLENERLTKENQKILEDK